MAAILIIEDDTALQEAYGFILQTAGHEVTPAFNGKEGLALAGKESFDVILLDIHMPVLDGWGFLGAYKPNGSVPPKIVVFSNMVEPELTKRAKALGAHQTVLKSSMTPATMLAMIGDLLEAS